MIIPRDGDYDTRKRTVRDAIQAKLEEMGHTVMEHISAIDDIRTNFNIWGSWRETSPLGKLTLSYGTGGIKNGNLRFHPEPKDGYDIDKIATSISTYFKAKLAIKTARDAREAENERFMRIATEVKADHPNPLIDLEANYDSITIAVELTDPDVIRRLVRRISDFLDLERIEAKD